MLKLKSRPLAEVRTLASRSAFRIGSDHSPVIGTLSRALRKSIGGCKSIIISRSNNPRTSCRLYTTMAPPKLETVLASIEDGIAFIKYNRPNNANALGRTTMGDLLKAFTWALDEPEVKVIIYTGEGRFFSAGMDLVGVPADGPVLPDEGVERLR